MLSFLGSRRVALFGPFNFRREAVREGGRTLFFHSPSRFGKSQFAESLMSQPTFVPKLA